MSILITANRLDVRAMKHSIGMSHCGKCCTCFTKFLMQIELQIASFKSINRTFSIYSNEVLLPRLMFFCSFISLIFFTQIDVRRYVDQNLKSFFKKMFRHVSFYNIIYFELFFLSLLMVRRRKFYHRIFL